MSGVDLGGLSVVVVDDNKHMHAILRGVLGAMRIKNVYAFDEPAEALKQLRQYMPDLVICDVAMEPIDGLEFTRLIRRGSDSPNPYVPIITLTGHTEAWRVKECINAGANHVCAKPISIKGIYTYITEIIAHPRPFVKSRNYFGPCRRRKVMPIKFEDRRAPESQVGTLLGEEVL